MSDVQYAGVDWLTMTSKDDKTGQQWYATYQQYKNVRRQEGAIEKPFHNGFYGGIRIASMSVGHSDVIGYIVIVSGGDAERLYQRLAPTQSRVTRLDLCFDFYYEQPRNVAAKLFTELQTNNDNKQRKFSLFTGSDGSATLYLGSRQSKQFGRVYDKGMQQKSHKPGHLWRAEIEFKKPLAGTIAKGLAKVEPEQREVVICDTISEWFARRNAVLFPLEDAAKVLHVGVQQRTTTAERKLAWLRQQVSPTITHLISAGYGRDVFEALLLDTEAISQAYTVEH